MEKDNVWKEMYGFFLPDGDTMWICPVCGKSKHIYGISTPKNYQTVCKHCGTTLRYPFEKGEK